MNYQRVGVHVGLTSSAPKQRRPQVTVSAELSVLVRDGAEITSGVRATSTRTLSTEHRAELVYGQPRVILAVDSASPDEGQAPAVYVMRYLFSR